MAEPPLRLILGSEAYAYAMAAARARAESDAAWHDLTISTDRDDATAAQRDPLAAARSCGLAVPAAGWPRLWALRSPARAGPGPGCARHPGGARVTGR